MTREPIHPGETLADDLETLGMSAADRSADEQDHADPERPARYGRRRAAGDDSSAHRGVPARPAQALRVEAGGTRSRRRHRRSAVKEPQAMTWVERQRSASA